MTELGLKEKRRRHVPNFALVRNQIVKPCDLSLTEQRIFKQIDKNHAIESELHNYFQTLKTQGQLCEIKLQNRPLLKA